MQRISRLIFGNTRQCYHKQRDWKWFCTACFWAHRKVGQMKKTVQSVLSVYKCSFLRWKYMYMWIPIWNDEFYPPSRAHLCVSVVCVFICFIDFSIRCVCPDSICFPLCLFPFRCKWLCQWFPLLSFFEATKQLYPILILFLSFGCFSFSLRIYALLIQRMINSFDQYPHDLYWGDSYAQASWMDNRHCCWRQKFI